MSATPMAVPVAMAACRAVARPTDAGFAAVAPLSGSRSVAAVGSVTIGLRRCNVDDARTAMRSVLHDQALLEGHDAGALLHRANAQLSAGAVGVLDAVALLTHPEDGVPASMVAAGWPSPVVVTPDHLTAAVGASVQLLPGWTVVLGARADATGGISGILSPHDVDEAVRLLVPWRAAEPVVPTSRTAQRTLLAIAIGG